MSAGSLYELAIRWRQVVLDGGGEVDPQPSGVASPGGDVAPLGPAVDDVGFDAEAAGGIGDAELVSRRGAGIGVAVLVGRAGGALAAGGFDLGWEGDAPAPGRAAAGGQVAGVDPVVDGAGGHAGELGDLARGELAVFEQAGVGDVVVAAQVGGGDPVEGLPGAGAVPGVVQRGGQGVVVQAGADAAGELDRRRVGAAQLDGVAAPGDRGPAGWRRISSAARPRSGRGRWLTG